MKASNGTALKIAVFGSGAVLMALEVLAFRIIGKTFGSALRETTAVIAVFLTSMSLGYLLGGRFGDRWPRARTLILPMVVAGASIFLVPTLDAQLSDRIFQSSLPLGSHAMLTCVALFVVPSLLAAMISPIAIRLMAQTVDETGKVAGSVSALSTVGSILGTVLTGFYLIDVFGSVTRLVYALGGVMLMLAAIAAFGMRRKAPGVLGAILLFALSGCYASADIIFERDSAYHHIVVRDEGNRRILLFDNAPQSQMDLKDPSSGGFEYADYIHCAFLFKPDIKDVLFLGLGGGSAPKRFLRDYPNAQIDAVDVDPVVIDVAKKYFAVKPGPRLRLITQDARVFIKRSKKQYDLIVLDAYTTNKYGSTVPQHLTTREFFGEVKARLKPGGAVAYNVISYMTGTSSGLARAILKTMNTQLTSPYIFQAESSWNSVLLAFNGTRHTMDRDALVRRAREMVRAGKIKLPGFEARVRRMEPVPDLKDAVILTDDYAPVDRLLRGG